MVGETDVSEICVSMKIETSPIMVLPRLGIWGLMSQVLTSMTYTKIACENCNEDSSTITYTCA